MRKSPTKHQYHSPHHAEGEERETSDGVRDDSTDNKPSQLVQLQEQFYNYASIEELEEKLELSSKLSTLIYNYWKLKRKVCHTNIGASMPGMGEGGNI